MLQKRCHLECLVFWWWSLQSRIESGCAGRREQWTPAWGRRSGEAGGGTQWSCFVAEANVLWNWSLNWVGLSWPPPGLGGLFLPLHLSSDTCCPVAMLRIGVLQVPKSAAGWQQGQGKLESLEVPFGGELMFKIVVKQLRLVLLLSTCNGWNLALVKPTSNTQWWSRARISQCCKLCHSWKKKQPFFWKALDLCVAILNFQC